MLSKFISVLILLSAVASNSLAAEKLKFDRANYDLEKGCFDSALNRFHRIKLTTAAEIQERLVAKDFECTEMSDVIIEATENGIGLLVHGDFKDYKVVGIEGSGGPLGSAGVFDINFKGAKITNLFLDYQAAIGGDASGIVASGIYLAFYAQFSTALTSKNCTKVHVGEAGFPLPPYVVRTDTALAIKLDSSIFNQPEFRDFSTNAVVCREF
jgi:hypothetical protein